MRRIVRLLAWRSNQPVWLRWLEAAVLFAVALAVRFSAGAMQGAFPSLTFYPAILLAALLLGWQEALAILALAIAAAWCFFLPPGQFVLPTAWALVGLLNIGIILALKALAQDLAQANERQRVLFQELQHRVANTLQAAAGRLQVIRNRIDASPAEAARRLDDAIQRMAQSADMHRRLYDPNLFTRGMEPMLRDVVASVIPESSIALTFRVEDMSLSLDQMSIIAMLVIESASNAMKHVFQHNLGSQFEVTLHTLPGNLAMLRTRDDGPGAIESDDAASTELRLGQRILQGLTDQIRGTLSIGFKAGTEMVVEFPTYR
jgi:two-component sensor histidine kinase